MRIITENFGEYLGSFYCVNEGSRLLVFEDYAEYEYYLNSLNVWSFDSWKAQVNELHNKLFEGYYLPLRYESESDIALTALNSARFAQEALELAKWRNDTYDIIDAVTEAEAQEITPQDFINTLPIFYVQEETED